MGLYQRFLCTKSDVLAIIVFIEKGKKTLAVFDEELLHFVNIKGLGPFHIYTETEPQKNKMP